MRQEDWKIVCRDARASSVDSKGLRQLADYLENCPEITKKYRKKVVDCLKKTAKATSPTIAITLLKNLILFFEHESTQPASTTTIRKVNGEQRLYMIGNVEVMVAEWFLAYVEPLRQVITKLEKFRENSSEAKTVKFKHSKKHQSDAGKNSKRPPNPLMLAEAERILKRKPPGTLQCCSSRALATHLNSDDQKSFTFHFQWVNTHLQHHIKNKRPR